VNGAHGLGQDRCLACHPQRLAQFYTLPDNPCGKILRELPFERHVQDFAAWSVYVSRRLHSLTSGLGQKPHSIAGLQVVDFLAEDD